ncbi:hypothetical protein [Chengkuizengella axinellae]|uniref:Band 7 domain-containing protein n=1 Tax=Chengkuizengella axinellae TaxID=3064388 RepID=A0ABT9J3X0_9BACL|nr:hypothetical protein [Chengkuizengella sp. 2205SS18-9]MDP5276137.1 hypothetical protein [Chengkuizengella sp. 2205SS18-9]
MLYQMIGLVVTVVAAIFVFVFLKKTGDKQEITTQDVIGKSVEISEEGIAKRGNMYRAVIEVKPINTITSSNQEKDSIWIKHRSFINMLAIPHTFIVQSQYLDMKDYTSWYQEESRKNEYLTPELLESANEVAEYYQKFDEKKKSRDFTGYIVIHFNPISDSIDSGVETGNAFFDGIFEKLKVNTKKISEEEKEDLSHQVIEEAVTHVMGACQNLGMQYRKLDKAGIYNMIYTTLQRELSYQVRLNDAIQAQSFTAQVDSITSRLLAYEYNEKGA